jgi:hypothetical protein
VIEKHREGIHGVMTKRSSERKIPRTKSGFYNTKKQRKRERERSREGTPGVMTQRIRQRDFEMEFLV